MTKIEWCDETWNPVTGCEPISEGCKNCYAKRMATRLRGRFGYPADEPFRPTVHVDRWDRPAKWKKPRRIFVCSMGDLFHETYHPMSALYKHIFRMVKENPQHTFMFLTKRPGYMQRVLYIHFTDYPPNMWVGVTAENQDAADSRVPILMQIPAAVHFVSVEPMLEQITLNYLHYDNMVEIDALNGTHGVIRPHRGKSAKLDWVICGAETGPGARYMKPKWAIDLRSQCHKAGIPFFFKQASKGDRQMKLPREFPNARNT